MIAPFFLPLTTCANYWTSPIHEGAQPCPCLHCLLHVAARARLTCRNFWDASRLQDGTRFRPILALHLHQSWWPISDEDTI